MIIPLLLALAVNASDIQATITVQTGQPGIRISPDLYGIFFEEINCSGDGGLYAEMVRNRSFEDGPERSTPVPHWSLVQTGSARGEMVLDQGGTDPKNPTSLKLTFERGVGSVGAANEGYWGIPAEQGQTYRFSCLAKGEGSPELTVRLESPAGTVYGQTTFTPGTKWATRRAKLTADATDSNARLVVSLTKPGTAWIDMVSLFPAKTYRNRPNGLRVDLAEKLADLHPSFMRFPGGNWVEGDSMAVATNWKRTIGALADRWTQPNPWGYLSTNGLGFYEYLQLCEDIGASPLFVINCGMALRGYAPMDQMGGYVEDALDAIEYANGPVTSKWGALRAASGHPGSFHLKYLEIGNENGGPVYDERFPLIAKAVHDRYPDIKIIADVWGGFPKTGYTQIVDEHYYSSPGFFFENADRYDRYDRRGPKVYVGEYAVTEGAGQGNLIAALGEAAFMTGMERNSDVVEMASYAPLFADVNHKGWNPDLICFDNERSYGTPSYYVQQMFSLNRGDRVLPTTIDLPETAKPTFAPGGVGVGTWGTQAEFKDIKVVHGGDTLFESADGSALTKGPGDWSVADGAIRQSGEDEPSMAYVPSGSWQDYTLTLKARKTGGREGFLIDFGLKDQKNWIWWNVGGWSNTQSALEQSVNGGKSGLGRAVGGSVETGRWYDIRVEFTPSLVRCYLDGKLIEEAACPAPKPLYVVSSRVDKTGEVIMKVVNSGADPVDAKIDLAGLQGALRGTAAVLTSASPLDENSLEKPRNVSPKVAAFPTDSPEFRHRFPAYSVTVLRMAQRK
ncbi:MAG TPA: alpha-L-arabinofuranosidase C-terminal domain-containing protein [Fimbriimonadaceae bacterium]|nr:alpha-L-arabinofuranosidase C-terminal domain-containing protein [Fimbriimonadaceae bacterium]